MKILIPGHKYQLEMMEGGFQIIQFIQKEVKNGKFVTVHNGTTNEEVLTVLIDRLEELNKKLSDPMNKIAIDLLHVALGALNARTAARIERGVENTPKP